MDKVQIVRVVTQKPTLDMMEDRAVSDFSAFAIVGRVHIKRVKSSYARNQILDVLEELRMGLLENNIANRAEVA